MSQSENISELAAALAKAQAVMDLPKRNREVVVKIAAGGNYKFEYTTFDAIIEHVREPLTANGLWFVQTIEIIEGGNALRTTLTHASGQWISGSVRIPPASKMQEFGSALTYLKRYALSSLLGIASEDDEDANVADGNTVESKHDKPPVEQPNRKTAATKWAAEAEATVRAFKTGEDLSAWHKVNANGIAAVRTLNEAAHKRLVETVQAKSADLSTLNAG